MDFILQNSLMFLLFYYYFTQNFLNEPTRKAYLAFLIIYVLVSTVPKIFVIFLSRIFDDYNRSCCSKFFDFIFLSFLSIIQGEYLWILFFYRFDGLSYSYKEALRNLTAFGRFAQMFVQVTMITILGINNVDNLIKGLTIGFSGFEFVFNIIMAACVLER